MIHKSTFHTETGDVLFFPQWVLHGRKETYLTCLILAVLGISYQGIKFARQQYGRKCRNMNCKRYILNKGHLLQTLMYLLQFIGGYVLMLSVMTYNLWILFAVLLGLGLGYFFFGWGEYEEHSAALHLPVPSSRHYLHSCTGASACSSATQELLSLGKEEEELIYREGASNNIGCTCGSSRV